MNNWRLIVTALFACCVATTALGQSQDVEGSKDHPLISRYPGSIITEYKQEDFNEFDLPASKYCSPAQTSSSADTESSMDTLGV